MLCVGVSALGLTACQGRTEPATDITATAATLRFTGTADDGPAYSYFEYWKTARPESKSRTRTRNWNGGASGTFPERVTGLEPHSDYTFRICGGDAGEPPACASTRSFPTLDSDSLVLRRGSVLEYVAATRSAVDVLVDSDSEQRPTTFIFLHGTPTGFVGASGSGCTTPAGDAHATELRCSSSGITRIRFRLGDRNDIATMDTNVVPVTMDGGDGGDSFRPTTKGDFLIGGPGSDILRGFEGDDTIDAQAPPGYPFEDNDLIFCGEGPVGDPDPNDQDRAFLDDLDEQHVDCETVSTERAPAPP